MPVDWVEADVFRIYWLRENILDYRIVIPVSEKDLKKKKNLHLNFLFAAAK